MFLAVFRVIVLSLCPVHLVLSEIFALIKPWGVSETSQTDQVMQVPAPDVPASGQDGGGSAAQPQSVLPYPQLSKRLIFPS